MEITPKPSLVQTNASRRETERDTERDTEIQRERERERERQTDRERDRERAPGWLAVLRFCPWSLGMSSATSGGQWLC